MAFPPRKSASAPSDFGDPTSFEDQAAPPPPDGAQDEQPGASPKISPEAVHYHEDPQSCSTCQYMDQGGNCAVLQMPVSPEGGCNAYSGGHEEPDQDDMSQPPPSGGDTGAAMPPPSGSY